MEKTLIVTIMVDSVPLSMLEQIQKDLEISLEDYPDKRITIQIQDEPMVRIR